MSKMEILAPQRDRLPAQKSETAMVAAPPRVDPGGIVSSALMRWEADRHARTLTAVAARTRAETSLFDAQTNALESYIKRQRAIARVQELPELIATERARRRMERGDELNDVAHRHELAELRRRTEAAQAQAALTDANQALRAQHDFGYTTYELAWKKKKCEMLDVELNEAERRAILAQHVKELHQDASGNSDPPSGGAIDDALYEARAELQAHGLDTTRIDSVIQSRNR